MHYYEAAASIYGSITQRERERVRKIVVVAVVGSYLCVDV